MNLLEPIKNNIPNAITCLNLLSGSLACICASHGSEHIGGDPVAITYYQLAFIMIAAAAVFDFFDGFVLREFRPCSRAHLVFHVARAIPVVVGGI